jgi:putative peptide zinc metalloprotease protein
VGRAGPEGRIVALYGVLAVLWLAIAANLAYRIWADRVAGLAPGCGTAALGGRLLLVGDRSGSARRCLPRRRPAGRWWRRSASAAPRRAARPTPRAGWPRCAPPTWAAARAGAGRPRRPGPLAAPADRPQLVWPAAPSSGVRGGGRRHAGPPGRDPGGTIRHHVGPGGCVGLANALTGPLHPAELAHAGTTLLAVPDCHRGDRGRPAAGPPPQDRAEAEALFADTPALAGLRTTRDWR